MIKLVVIYCQKNLIKIHRNRNKGILKKKRLKIWKCDGEILIK